MSEYDEMLATCNKAIEDDPNDVDAYNGRGIINLLLEQYDAAISDLSRAIALDPNRASAYRKRGEAYGRKEQWDSSKTDFNKVISLEPNNADAYGGRAIACFRMSQYEAAISDFSKAITFDSDRIQDYYFRGDAYRRMGQWDLARADLEKVLQREPEHKGAKASLQAVSNFKEFFGSANVEAEKEKKAREEREAAERAAAERRKEAAEKAAAEKRKRRPVGIIGFVLQLGVAAFVFYLFVSGNKAFEEGFQSLPVLLQMALPVGLPALVIGIISLLFRRGINPLISIGLIILMDIAMTIYMIISEGAGAGIGIMTLIVFSISAIPGFLMAAK